jgi:hypothetical protein
LAELEYTTLNTQEYANAYGECILNPYDYAFNVPANYAHFRQSGMSGADAVSKDNANGVGKGNLMVFTRTIRTNRPLPGRCLGHQFAN